jgi:hypothetical protein
MRFETIFVMATIFSSCDTEPINILLSRGRLFTFGAPTDCPAQGPSCLHIRCRWNVFTELLPLQRASFCGRYPATGLRATIFNLCIRPSAQNFRVVMWKVCLFRCLFHLCNLVKSFHAPSPLAASLFWSPEIIASLCLR